MRVYLMYTDVFIMYIELPKYRLDKVFSKIYLHQLKIKTMLLFHPKLFEGFICICQRLSNSRYVLIPTDSLRYFTFLILMNTKKPKCPKEDKLYVRMYIKN